MTASVFKTRSKHVKDSKERLFIMTQTHNLLLCVCVIVNKRYFQIFYVFGYFLRRKKSRSGIEPSPFCLLAYKALPLGQTD